MMSSNDEARIREIVREELEKGIIKDLKDAVLDLRNSVKKLRLIIDDLAERQNKLRIGYGTL